MMDACERKMDFPFAPYGLGLDLAPDTPTPLPRNGRGDGNTPRMRLNVTSPGSPLPPRRRHEALPGACLGDLPSVEVRLFVDFLQIGETRIYPILSCYSLSDFICRTECLFESDMSLDQVDMSDLHFLTIKWEQRSGNRFFDINPGDFQKWQTKLQAAMHATQGQGALRSVVKIDVHLRDENKWQWASVVKEIKIKQLKEDREDQMAAAILEGLKG